MVVLCKNTLQKASRAELAALGPGGVHWGVGELAPWLSLTPQQLNGTNVNGADDILISLNRSQNRMFLTCGATTLRQAFFLFPSS